MLHKIKKYQYILKEYGFKFIYKRVIFSFKQSIVQKVKKLTKFVAPKTNITNNLIDYNDSKYSEYQLFTANKTVNSFIKIIAFYLPQFHPFKENDEFWGKGFTEWTNVTKSKPNFIGHYQPHLPIHLGFYDLRLIENMQEQVLLAKNYGITGFCFYYYWFSGKKVMDLPIENLYNNKDIEIEYCICWANENWTRRWDGHNEDILLKQEYLINDSEKLILEINKYFYDERYIKIDNKPVIIIYNSLEIPDFQKFIDIMRKEAVKLGWTGIYIICAKTGNYISSNFDIDAMVEFPPHDYKQSENINSKLNIVNSDYKGWIYDYNLYANAALTKKIENKLFKTVMLGWDNTARRQNLSTIFNNFSINKFSQLVSQRLHSIARDDKLNEKEKILFINAWNEWAEGTHLEPDRKYGFSYLNAVYKNIKNFDIKYQKFFDCNNYIKNHSIAIIFHLYYTDTLQEFIINSKQYHNIADFYFTIVDSVISDEIIQRIKMAFPNSNIFICENRGRDILPFIKIYKNIKKLNYKYVCKLHSKQSKHLESGKGWFQDLLDKLLLKDFEDIKNLIDANNGLLIPNKYGVQIKGVWNGFNSLKGNLENIKYFCNLLNIKIDLDSYFPAGTMFWFNSDAFSGIESIEDMEFSFENGAFNGEKQHAIERILGLLCIKNGYLINLY